MVITILMGCAISLGAQTQRSEDFRAKYELKEVVVMSRHNIRSPLSSGADYIRTTPYEWFAWSSPGSQLSLSPANRAPFPSISSIVSTASTASIVSMASITSIASINQ